MRKLSTNPNVDNSDLANYPDGRVKNNTGVGDGTPVDERVYGDLHQTIAKLMRLYGIDANDLPDNETNGFQIIAALRALASKNDFILALTVDTGIVQVPVKIGSMLDGEQIVCKAAFNVAAETQIKGSDNVTVSFTKIGNFKTGEYVRVIRVGAAILLVRLVDLVNLDLAVGEFLYLKAANYAQELAGVSQAVATTPYTNALVFTERVNGDESDLSLAIPNVRNGLLSKEWAAILAAGDSVKNRGSISGVDLNTGSVGTAYAHDGDIVSATIASVGNNDTTVLVTMAHAMSGTNYYVRFFHQSQGAITNDNDIGGGVCKPLSSTTFHYSNSEMLSNKTQNLKIFFEVVQL